MSAARRPRPGLKAHVGRFASIAAIFLTAQAAIVGCSWAAIEVINIARAYAAGEGLYSKSQKLAVLSLHRYAASGAAEDYADFRAAIAVPLGDNRARRALELAEPDFAAAEDGFLQGRNHPSDVWGMARLFVWLGDWTPFARAVRDWREAEPLIDGLERVGTDLHAAMESGALTPERRTALLSEADRLDRGLTILEDSFSLNMGEAARAARDLLLLLLGIGGALLLLTGLTLAWRAHAKGLGAEERLAAGEQRFRDFAEVASDWFWEMDEDLRVSYLSPRFAEVTGFRSEDVIGRTGLTVAEEDVALPHWQEHLQQLAARAPFQNFVHRVGPPDGSEQFWSVSGKPLFDRDGVFRGYRGTGNNVTAIVSAQRAMRIATEAAEIANRSKSVFLANMSHELRTPLNSIMGFSELLADPRLSVGADPRYPEYAGYIHQAAAHLLKIINDILDLSKIESGKAEIREEQVDLRYVIRSVCLLMQERAARADIRLEASVPDDLPRFLGDERAMMQILTNLVSNALKFTPPDGRVRIEAALAGTGEPGVGEPHEGGLVIAVRDTGIGIAETDIPIALAPFGQIDSALSRNYQGTGLGLPLTRSLVEMHQGRLEIQSAPGAGTSVLVHLPAGRLIRGDDPVRAGD